MSTLVCSWLNNRFRLSRRIESPEVDLSNGFVLVQILKQLDIISEDDAASATDTSNVEQILSNFRIIQKFLKSINISLSKEDISNIVSEVI